MTSKFIFTISLLILTLSLFAKETTQTVRGVIIDEDTQSPLIGATVQILGSDPIIGSITDINGKFRFDHVPIGRISLNVSYIGYDEKTISNLLISSAKETVLEISLLESVQKLNEIVVTAKSNQSEVLNEMSIVSARSFTVEETKRYAGSFADPARMASAFAGVTNDPEGNNDIIVRGNSPRGILWRLEGIEIPNPNHFTNEGATGGPINALNSNMLSDSDFSTGAFAPEYGNALSGVFDMKLKKGNNEKREYTAGFSTLGIDFTVEGPFKKGYGGSYLANYRYSSLALISNLGILDFGGIPKYQDLSFRVHLPINKDHFISVFGLGGISNISVEESEESPNQIDYKEDFGADMGTIGVTHNYLLSKRTFIKTTLAASGTHLKYLQQELNDGSFQTERDSDFRRTFLKALTTLNHKFNAQHKLETGIIYTGLGYNLRESLQNEQTELLETTLQDDGRSYMTQAFTTWKYRISKDLTFVGGLHYLHFGLNNNYNIEPRGAIKWQATRDKSFSLGAGVHSRIESLSVYLGKEQQEDGTLIAHNRNLSPSKALHLVIGYDQNIGSHLHAKIEAYYQSLYDVPIVEASGSHISLLNSSDDFLTTPMVNDGTGRNYGMELTLERYLHNNFYFLASASIYQSLYTARDGIERNTAFAGNYTFNLLGGKEWKVGRSHKNKVFFLNTKVSLIGSKPYTPIDLEASIDQGFEIRDNSRPFSVRGQDIFIFNFSIGTRKNKKNTTQEFKIDIQNATFSEAPVGVYYSESSQEIEKSVQLPFFPTISYSISF